MIDTSIDASIITIFCSFIVLRKFYIEVFIRLYNLLKYNFCQKITY
jgi:hypothetical protein